MKQLIKNLPEHLRPVQGEHGPAIFNLGDPDDPDCVQKIRQWFEVYMPSALSAEKEP